MNCFAPCFMMFNLYRVVELFSAAQALALNGTAQVRKVYVNTTINSVTDQKTECNNLDLNHLVFSPPPLSLSLWSRDAHKSSCM